MTRISTSTKWAGESVKVLGHKVVFKSVWATALHVEQLAKNLCARNYGYLAASINAQMKDKGDKLESPTKYAKSTIPATHAPATFKTIQPPTADNEAHVGTAVDYGPHVEYGTIKMDAQPFLRPALDLAKGDVLEIVKAEGKNHFFKYLLEHENYLQSRGV